MTQKTYITLTATVFLIAALGHIMKIVIGFDIIIDGWMVPRWISLVGIIVAGFLSYLGFKIRKI